jgi:hypothetical protein
MGNTSPHRPAARSCCVRRCRSVGVATETLIGLMSDRVPAEEALKLQRPLADGALRIVASGVNALVGYILKARPIAWVRHRCPTAVSSCFRIWLETVRDQPVPSTAKSLPAKAAQV